MTLYTNMLWPDDPYGTGQLWRKEPQLLAAFAATRCGRTDHSGFTSFAVTYLRLHRTQRLDLSCGLRFGFRALTATEPNEEAVLVQTLDLDAMRARRLASVVAGHRLGAELREAGLLSGDGTSLRGLGSLVHAWEKSRTRGHAEAVEISAEISDAGLESTACAARIDMPSARHGWKSPEEPDRAPETDQSRDEALALRSVEQSLIIGLLAGRHLGSCSGAR